MANNAKIVDTKLIRQAGMQPTKDEIEHSMDDPELKPNRRRERSFDAALYTEAKQFLRHIDEQDAIGRFRWYNLPTGINGEELERFLYYKGQLAFFYMPETDEFYFMPYCLDGTIDFYGRYNTIHCIPIASTQSDIKDKDVQKQATMQARILAERKLKCYYGIPAKPLTDDEATKAAVILRDHCKQLSETVTPRQRLNDGLVGLEAQMLAYLRTHAIANSGVKGLRVNSDDEAINVHWANSSLKNSALSGEVFTAIKGTAEFQDLLEKIGSTKMEEYLMAMQGVDNLRLSGFGLESGGVFEKKAHVLQSENDMNASNVGIILNDDLAIRQNFCIVANSIFGTSMWCEEAEPTVGVDKDGDGKAGENNIDGSASAVENKGGNDDGKTTL